MNIRLLAKLLGILSALIGGFMLFSLPWAVPGIGRHTTQFEQQGFWALVVSIVVCLALGFALYRWGRNSKGKLYRKEAMAVVGLSWVLATVLGAMPFYLSGTLRSPSIRVTDDGELQRIKEGSQWINVWQPLADLNLSKDELKVLTTLATAESSSLGLDAAQLTRQSGLANAELIIDSLNSAEKINDWLILPRETDSTADRASNIRIRWCPMTVCDALFESQSGFSTTGASVMSELEDPVAISSCIHFWRSSTHFLGGLGIIVLFVVLLGQGSAGKTLMRTEVPGPTSDSMSAKMQHSAWRFAGIYVALNIILTFLLMALGMGLFDAICHAFGTMATGGFSTYNASLGGFQSPAIEYVVILFMILAGTNFLLLYLVILKQPGRLLADVEWRTYIGIIAAVTAVVMFAGWRASDEGFTSFEQAFRNGLFQVVSVITTTGFGTNDFNSWNQFGRLLMLLLMFVGGCAGSTGGGMKVIRHFLLVKILWLEIEKAFHPRLIKPLRIQSATEINEKDLKHSILVYVGVVAFLFVLGWLAVVAIEPVTTWSGHQEDTLIDSASAVASTLNNIGPGVGVVGPTHNYGDFTGTTKLLFVLLMMLGRLEIWPILVLFAPRFWKAN